MSDIDSAVTALLELKNSNGQAHPLALPDGGTLPQFIYKLIDTPYRQTDHNGVQGSMIVTAKYRVKVYDETLFDARAEAKTLTMALNGYSGTVGGVEIFSVFTYGDNHDHDPAKRLFWVNFTMDVMYREE